MSQQQRARLTLPWSDTAWPPLSASEPAVLWEPLRQLTLAVSDADQNGPAVTRWSLRFCGSYYQTRGGMEGSGNSRGEEAIHKLSLEIWNKTNPDRFI